MIAKQEGTTTNENPIIRLQVTMDNHANEVPEYPWEPDKRVYSLFKTNEILSKSNEKNTRLQPNGYIIGVGFGSILQMPSLFSELQPPKGIVTTDIMPEVVLSGRVLIQALKENPNADEFFVSLRDEDTIQRMTSQVVQQETSPILQKRFGNPVIQERVKAEIRKANSDVSDFFTKNPQADGYVNTRDDLVRAVSQNYALFHKLASEGNISIVLADMSNPVFVEEAKKLPNFGLLRNVVYISNIIDHIREEATDSPRVTRLNNALTALDTSHANTFVSSKRGPANVRYPLRIENHPPQY